MRAYKLFRTRKDRPGELFPLFIDRQTAVPQGVWVDAECVPTKGYAVRPGWHVAPAPHAPHLYRKDGTIPADRVWAEVEIPDIDAGWQRKADASPTGDVRDRIPRLGFYRFPRPASQGGEWIIAGKLRVVRVLDPEEVTR